MFTYTPYPHKMFEYITADVKTKLGLTVLHYEHGHPLEIVDTLIAMTKSQVQTLNKFPLIALYQDFDEKRGEDPRYFDVSFHLVIATITLRAYLASARYTNIFIPTLIPIYNQLMISICASGYFRQSSPGKVQHTKTDRLFWGKSGIMGSEGMVYSDHIDAIELTDLQLSPEIKCNHT